MTAAHRRHVGCGLMNLFYGEPPLKKTLTQQSPQGPRNADTILMMIIQSPF